MLQPRLDYPYCCQAADSAALRRLELILVSVALGAKVLHLYATLSQFTLQGFSITTQAKFGRAVAGKTRMAYAAKGRTDVENLAFVLMQHRQKQLTELHRRQQINTDQIAKLLLMTQAKLTDPRVVNQHINAALLLAKLQQALLLCSAG